MDKIGAVRIINNCTGFMDPTSSAGEAWDFIQQYIEGLEEALTPSAETKAAYMGEFSMEIVEFDENGDGFPRNVHVPWVTIKDIMKVIRNRAQVLDMSNETK